LVWGKLTQVLAAVLEGSAPGQHSWDVPKRESGKDFVPCVRKVEYLKTEQDKVQQTKPPDKLHSLAESAHCTCVLKVTDFEKHTPRE
jgi:hypothetical protein